MSSKNRILVVLVTAVLMLVSFYAGKESSSNDSFEKEIALHSLRAVGEAAVQVLKSGYSVNDSTLEVWGRCENILNCGDNKLDSLGHIIEPSIDSLLTRFERAKKAHNR